jgi:hypothetical protein
MDFAGKGVDNKDQTASIAGAVAGANYVRPRRFCAQNSA